MNDTLNPKELLEYAQDAVFFHLGSDSRSTVYERYGNKTSEDLAMDSIERILASKVYPQTKTYVRKAVLYTCLDALKGKRVIPSYHGIPKYNEITGDPTKDALKSIPEVTVELFDIDDVYGEIWEHLSPEEAALYAQLYEGVSMNTLQEQYNCSEASIRRHITALRLKIDSYLIIS